MKHQPIYLCVFFLIISFFGYSQQYDFESGYYIDNDNIKKEGFLLKRNFVNSPEQIRYKRSMNSEE